MRSLESRFGKLVMVCNNQRPEGSQKPSCGYHGAGELRAWLKAELKKDGIWGKKVRVITTSCLDVCPKAGVICSFDEGRTLQLVDSETEREAVLDRIRHLVETL